MPNTGTLVLMCGKMAAGKSTLSRQLAGRDDAVLLVQDEFLARLFPGEIVDIPSFLERAGRLMAVLTPLIGDLLAQGLTVVLDFPGNTRRQRAWFRELIDRTGADHELHVIDASDDICKRQLRQRSAALPEGSRWTSDAEFDAITALFEPPAPDERFTIVRHERR